MYFYVASWVYVLCILFISFPFPLFYEPNTHVLTFLLLNAYLSKIFFDEHINSSGELTRRAFPQSTWASFPSSHITRYIMEQPRWWRRNEISYACPTQTKIGKDSRKNDKGLNERVLKMSKVHTHRRWVLWKCFHIFMACVLFVVRVVNVYKDCFGFRFHTQCLFDDTTT